MTAASNVALILLVLWGAGWAASCIGTGSRQQRREQYRQGIEDLGDDVTTCDCPACDRWRCEDAWLLPVADEPTGRQ